MDKKKTLTDIIFEFKDKLDEANIDISKMTFEEFTRLVEPKQ